MKQNTDNNRTSIRWYDWPGLALFFALMLVVFLQFFTRYMLNDSLAWTEEIARYLLVLMVYAGALSALVRSEHIVLEVVYRYAPLANAKPLALQSEIISLAYYGALTIGAAALAASNKQALVSIPIPKAYIYFGIALYGFTLCVGTLLRLKLRLKQSANDIHAQILSSSGSNTNEDAPNA